PGVAGQEAADDALTAPVAVDVGRVEEGDPGLDRRAQHVHRVGLGHVAPVRAELPGTQADHRNRPSCPAENPLFHGPRSYPGPAASPGPGPTPAARTLRPGRAPRPGRTLTSRPPPGRRPG